MTALITYCQVLPPFLLSEWFSWLGAVLLTVIKTGTWLMENEGVQQVFLLPQSGNSAIRICISHALIFCLLFQMYLHNLK